MIDFIARNSFKIKLYNLTVLICFICIFFPFNKSKLQPTEPQQLKPNITIDTLSVGEELDLVPKYISFFVDPKVYEWRIDNEQIVGLTVNTDHSATVIAKSKGAAEISISSPKGKTLASYNIKVNDLPGDEITKILAIGNSFSEDAVEHYLYGLAKAAGKKLVVGNMYIGGASLDLHWENASNNVAAYSYRKIDEDGNRTKKPNVSIAMALADEDWDYISFQQVSSNSGQYNTFVIPLYALHNYVKEKTTNSNVKYILHQTWSYAQSSTHSGFTNYGNDQEAMYKAIVSTYSAAKDLIDAEMIVPAGTAIQNGRTSDIKDNFNRDGYHLNKMGMYTASCTWFEKIFDESVIDNGYKVTGLSNYETEIAQHAAHLAIIKPNAVTPMVEYQDHELAKLIDIALIKPVNYKKVTMQEYVYN